MRSNTCPCKICTSDEAIQCAKKSLGGLWGEGPSLRIALNPMGRKRKTQETDTEEPDARSKCMGKKKKTYDDGDIENITHLSKSGPSVKSSLPKAPQDVLAPACDNSGNMASGQEKPLYSGYLRLPIFTITNLSESRPTKLRRPVVPDALRTAILVRLKGLGIRHIYVNRRQSKHRRWITSIRRRHRGFGT